MSIRALGLVPLAGLLVGAGQASPVVRPLEEDREHLAFEVALPAVSVRAVPGPTGMWTLATVSGLGLRAEDDRPLLPEAVFLVAVPWGTRPTLEEVRILAEAPLESSWPPGVVRLASGGGSVRIEPDRDTPLPPLLEVELVGVVRHLHLARLRLAPVRYDRATGTWRAVRRLEVRLRFEDGAWDSPQPSMPSLELDRTDEFWAGQVVNPSTVPLAIAPASSAPQPSTSSISEPQPSVMTPVKILVRRTGIHRVTYADLAGAGVDPTGIDPATFVLTNRGVEVPIEVTGEEDGSFDPGDAIRFFGETLDSEETWDNVYRLTGGVRAGLRMEARDVTPDPLAPVPNDFRNTAYQETDVLYWASIVEPDSPWYWDKLAVTTPGTPSFVDYNFDLRNVSADATLVGRVEVRIRSRRETPGPSPNHHVRVYFNGNLVDDQRWTGLQARILGGDIPQGWIVEGINTVRVENPADLGLTTQEEWTDWVRVEYYDRFAAESDYLAFDAATTATQKIEVTAFSGSDIVGYDVSDPLAPRRLAGFEVVPDGTGFRVRLSNAPGTAAGPFVLLREGAALAPFGLVVDRPSDLRAEASRGADLLIVVHENFRNAIQPLADHREAGGLRVVVAPLTEVYDEFNGGIAETQGIRNFVQWAFENYAPPAPTYLLLVGDATFDPKDLKGEGDNYVPAFFYYQDGVGYAPSDSWYGAVSGGDLVPDLAVGRVSARTPTDVTRYVNNLIGYESSPPVAALNSGLLYVADDDDASFETLLEDLIAKFQPPAMQARRVYLNDYPQTASGVDQATQAIRDALDIGSLVTTYAGHGARTQWAGENLWVNGDVSTLQPTGHLSFVLALNCVNGLFTALDAEPYSLGEEWGRRPDRGAVGNWAPSATGTLLNYDVLADRFFEQLFRNKNTRLGNATWQAVLTAHLVDAVPLIYVQQMIHFGDPAALAPLDSDRDGFLDTDELAAGTEPDDADTDDDGLLDNEEPSWDADSDGDGAVNAADYDADDDGLPDGLESGVTTPPAATDTSAGHFTADADPGSTTNPRDPDTDGGGAPDGAEDRDANGAVGPGETDANDPLDDPACAATVPPEVTGLLLAKSGSDAVLSWDDLAGSDPCVLYRVYVAEDPGRPDSFDKFRYAGTVGPANWAHRGGLADGRDAYYLVSATSPTHGEGALGHYGL